MKILTMNPFSKTWNEWKKSYPKNKFDSYYNLSRREGALPAMEKFQCYNFLSRFVPQYILWKFFCWYGMSKFGHFAQQPLSGSGETPSPKSAEPTSDNGKRCRKYFSRSKK